MKKILGVSFAAMLAVSPMLANAAVTATSAQIAAANTDVAANTNVATTSYVKGAYKAMATEVNKVQADVANVISDINVNQASQVEGGVVTSSNSVAQNLVALDNAVKNAASSASTTYQLQQNSNVQSTGEGDLNYITAGTGVAANLKALDDQVAANAGAISAETTRATGVESGLDTRLTTAEGNITTLTSTVGDSNSGLMGRVGNVETTIGNASMGTNATTVTGAIGEIEGRVDDVEAGLANALEIAEENYATKEGVVATINHSTASGAVSVYGNWGTPDTATDTVTIASTVTSPATNAYYATIGAASGTTQTDTTPAQQGSGD